MVKVQLVLMGVAREVLHLCQCVSSKCENVMIVGCVLHSRVNHSHLRCGGYHWTPGNTLQMKTHTFHRETYTHTQTFSVREQYIELSPVVKTHITEVTALLR